MGLFTAQTVQNFEFPKSIFTKFGTIIPNWYLNRSVREKKLNFQNPRWRTAAILKTVKSPYLRNRLADFDEIWHDGADWPFTGDRSLKFRIFQKPRWQRPPS